MRQQIENDDPQPTGQVSSDKQVLLRVERKLQLVRDRTVGVAQGRYTGSIIVGRGGIGKSYTVLEELERVKADYVLSNTHLTPRGLFDVLSEHPSSVHVIEDAEAIVRNISSVSVLRSALWASRQDCNGIAERLIVWKTNRERLEVVFSGGIILIANRPLNDSPETIALTTRIPCFELHLSNQEIAALMRHIAKNGYSRGDLVLGPAECLEVANFVIEHSARINRTLDMRLLKNGFEDRIQSEDFDAGCRWRDLVYSTLCRRPSITGSIDSIGVRQQKKTEQLIIARELSHLEKNERLKRWREVTGASQATLYRRLAELGESDSLPFQE